MTRNRKTAPAHPSAPIFTARPGIQQGPIVYTCEAYGRAPYDVARDFARTNWDIPRQLRHDTVSVDGLFEIADGRAVYSIVYVDAVPNVSPAIYQIFRYDPPSSERQ